MLFANREKRRHSFQWIGISLTVLALGFGWADVIRGGKAANAEEFALLIIFTGYVIGERIIGLQAHFEQRDILRGIKSTRDQIETRIINTITATYVGNHRDGLQLVIEKLAKAEYAKDTYFRMYPDLAVFGYPDTGSALYKAYEDLAERGGTVELIISKHNLEPVRQFAQSLTSLVLRRKSVSQFMLYELDNGDIPIPNVVILTYKKREAGEPRPRELFFGWNFKDRDGIVFSSTDKTTIDYFDRWFEALKNSESTWQYDIRQGFDKLAYLDRKKTGRRVEFDSIDQSKRRGPITDAVKTRS